MAEPRRVPFVSLSPIKPREIGGGLSVEHQHQRTPPPPPPTQPAQRPSQPRPQPPPTQQQREAVPQQRPAQLPLQRPPEPLQLPQQREAVLVTAREMQQVQREVMPQQRPQREVPLTPPQREAGSLQREALTVPPPPAPPPQRPQRETGSVQREALTSPPQQRPQRETGSLQREALTSPPPATAQQRPQRETGSLQREALTSPPPPSQQQRPQREAFTSPPPQQQRLQRETPTSATPVLTREPGVCQPKVEARQEEEKKQRPRGTVRLELSLTDPTEESCAEFSYPELVQSEQRGGRVSAGAEKAAGQAKLPPSHDPFNDDERERLQVENLAKKFEAKYGGKSHRHRKDRMQDLIDIGYGYDDTDPFIDNSEAYDELVPASLTTKYGGFYINTGTLQFRQASDSEGEDFIGSKKHKSSKVSKLNEGDDRSLKKRKRKEGIEEQQPRKLKVPKQMGVVAFNSHKPDKKKKKLYKDSLSLAAMLRKFQKEKDAIRKKESKQSPPAVTVVTAPPKPVSVPITNDLTDLTLGADPVLDIFGGGEGELLQEAESALEMLGDFDFDKLLDSASNDSPVGSDPGENGSMGGLPTNISQVQIPKQVPPFPEGLPTQLEKRISDLLTAAKMFDEEGRKKFFTQEMNNILLDIELQLQELSPSNRNSVYGYLEAFVPCNRDTLVKRMKKLHFNIQDDRLKQPLQRLKLAISSVMPHQLNRYQEDCQAHNQAKNAKHQADDGERNGSEDDDEEKPSKRVLGPRKKFYWDETIRNLLCNLVKIKLGCFELELNKSQTAEDYLKTFMETEVKSLWPKGWMQSRLLFKESRSVHNHLTSATAKKKVILAPKPKVKESSPKKEQKTSTPLPTWTRVPALSTVTPIGGPISSNCTPSSETICLDDSLDEDLSFKPVSLDSISEALAVLHNGTNAPSSSIDTPTSRPRSALREEKLASIMSKLPLGGPKKADPSPHTSSLIAGHSAPVPKKPQDLAAAHSTVVSGLIAGSSIQNPKVSLEPLPAKLLQQGMHRCLQAEVSSSSTPAKVKASSATQAKAGCSSSSSTPLISSSQTHVSSSSSQVQNPSSLQAVKVHQQPPLQQNYVSPLQVTISKSHTNPVVRLTSSPHISSTSPALKTPDKTASYRPPSSPSPGSQPHPPVSRTATSSTSSNFLSKTIGAQGSSPGFKSPYTLAPPKPTTSPSSSSAGTLVSQSTTHHKLTSGINIGRPSPTVSPLPAGLGIGGMQGMKNPSVPPKIPSLSPKLSTLSPRQTSPSPRQPSPSPRQPSPSPRQPSLSPRLPNQSPRLPNQSPRLPSPSPRLPSPSPRLPSPLPSPSSKPLNFTSPGTVKTTVGGAVLNVPISRAILGSSTTSRTNLSGGAGSGTLGATKQPTPLRQPSASGSPVTAATVQSAAASLLANTSPLTLMASQLSVTNQNVTSASLAPFGMLGGLVPVTMPFQFPLELLGFGSDTASVVTSPGSTSAAFHHNLTQNLLKGLQTNSPHTPTISLSSLPAHLQQAFTAFYQNWDVLNRMLLYGRPVVT
ncbi:ubinuclein-2 isoform X5 [Ascaphus truei]